MRVPGSIIWAFLIAVGVLAWMFSDDYLSSPADNFSDIVDEVVQLDTDAVDDTPNFIVAALKVENSLTEVLVRGSGVTEPSFEQPIQARRDGVIVSLPAIEGDRVQQKDILVELDTGTLETDIVAAEANRNAAAKAYEASKKLASRNLSTELDLVRAIAALRSSEATIAQLEEQKSYTSISAPQSGHLEELNVRIGEIVSPNQQIGLLIGLDDLFLTMPVPQAQISQISVGEILVPAEL